MPAATGAAVQKSLSTKVGTSKVREINYWTNMDPSKASIGWIVIDPALHRNNEATRHKRDLSFYRVGQKSLVGFRSSTTTTDHAATMARHQFVLLLIVANVMPVASFSSLNPAVSVRGSFMATTTTTRHRSVNSRLNAIASLRYDPILDFTKEDTFDKIDRLDDAVMGGISTSSVQAVNGCAMWGGVCRTDGG